MGLVSEQWKGGAMHMQKPVSALCAHREAVMGGRGPVSAWSKGPERQTALRAPQGKRQLLPGQERWAPPPQPSACVPKPLPPCPAQAELHQLQEHQQSKSTRLLNRLYLLYQILPNFLFYLLIPSASLSPKECTSFFKARWEGLTVHLILRLPIALSSTPGHA